MAAILTRHLGPGCNNFLNDDLGMGRLTGTSSSGSPCQEEGSPTPVNSAGELPVAILLAGGTVLAKTSDWTERATGAGQRVKGGISQCGPALTGPVSSLVAFLTAAHHHSSFTCAGSARQAMAS
ncbi:hypothetical protein F7725_016609 [Dissostichus mawsoni]|uniref:Uncharacterized protein n=1 Tax=Dissostichus mawsoni TaxID=36200 RepID=A0A7J5Z2S7_DISMA|nr:hypothetical protein F7725_016609 [Dissostichus mawsoni]